MPRGQGTAGLDRKGSHTIIFSAHIKITRGYLHARPLNLSSSLLFFSILTVIGMAYGFCRMEIRSRNLHIITPLLLASHLSPLLGKIRVFLLTSPTSARKPRKSSCGSHRCNSLVAGRRFMHISSRTCRFKVTRSTNIIIGKYGKLQRFSRLKDARMLISNPGHVIHTVDSCSSSEEYGIQYLTRIAMAH